MKPSLENSLITRVRGDMVKSAAKWKRADGLANTALCQKYLL